MKKSPGHIVFYDGFCRFCTASVKFIARNNSRRNVYFAPLTSPVAMKMLQLAPEKVRNSGSVIYFRDGSWFMKSSAALEVSRQLKKPWNYLKYLKIIPVKWRDRVYDFIARNRYRWFGTKDPEEILSSEEKNKYSKNFLS